MDNIIKSIILYASYYGTSKAYAEKLGQMTDIKVENQKDFKRYSDYDRFIYIGGLYAGKIKDLSQFLKKAGEKEVYIITVGMGNPEDAETVRIRMKQLKSQLGNRVIGEDKIFHLNGAMDYDRMSTIHRLMMKGFCFALKKKPIEKRSEMDQDIIDSYNKSIDYKNFEDLEKIKEVLSK